MAVQSVHRLGEKTGGSVRCVQCMPSEIIFPESESWLFKIGSNTHVHLACMYNIAKAEQCI